jgi:signal transduction histidine kinase
VWRDWALVGALVPATVIEGVLTPVMPWRVLSVIITVGLMFTLLWRRTRPLLVVAVAFGTCALVPLVTDGAALSQNVLVFMVLLAYSLFRWGSGREAVLGTAVMVGKVGVGGIVGQIDLLEVTAGFVFLSTAMATGAAVRYRARARARELDQAKLLERERIARDLHDTVAHHVSAMAIRAQAGLATAGTHPDAATDALRLIEAEASRALAEMRTMVRVLRQDAPADLTPNPGIGDLERLADPGPADPGPADPGPAGPRLAGAGRAGPAVAVEIVGDVEDLPPSVGSAIYRLAQESVTNARRHARHATRIEVHVAADDDAVCLRVSDDGDGPARAAGASGSSGYGLVGMAERATLLGGRCEAGPNPDRGWTVTAVLPRTGTATGTAA